ncbi:MAG TPA: hypothetical protein VFQ68_39220 [Streptosporangiaceae bacterium]|nr:hypothetical protein [Streptosporangiaceae bacterium]
MSVSQAAVSLSAEQGQVLGLLLPCLAGMAVDRAEVSGDLVRVWVHAVAGGAACPDCGTWCTQVHGRYLRRLRDAAAGGRRVLIWLAARVLCEVGVAPRRLGAPRVGQLAARDGRGCRAPAAPGRGRRPRSLLSGRDAHHGPSVALRLLGTANVALRHRRPSPGQPPAAA